MEDIESWGAHTFLKAIEDYKWSSYHIEKKYAELVNFAFAFALQGSWQLKKDGWEEVYYK
jgi:hypothetical protein